MCGQTQHVAITMGRPQPGRRAVLAVMLLVCAAVAAPHASALRHQSRSHDKDQDTLDETRRREGEALLDLADAAMAGRPASDFPMTWSNDFFKAQTGTFVPFTVTIDRSALNAPDALMYVRAARRNAPAAAGPGRYPFDIIFPVALSGPPGQPLRITRGFAVAPGDYDVYVALRERTTDPGGGARRLRSAVLKQPLSVPDFWTRELATSTVMLADRIDRIAAAVEGDALLERPYAIGTHEVHRAFANTFRQDRELIVVFLIYNPTVHADNRFDIEVDYHLFRKDARPQTSQAPEEGHPPARAGEAYVTRTAPQRFTPAMMGSDFNPVSGPILAGQGILLSSFQAGEYRLGITVTDLTSRLSLSRDVIFTVAGS
jgi:hypothetical protein